MAYEVDGARMRARRIEKKNAAVREERSDWSQEAVASEACVDRRTVGNMERKSGQRFERSTIEEVCAVLDLEPDAVILHQGPGDVRPVGPHKIDLRPARVWSAPDWPSSRLVVGLDGLGLEPRPGLRLAYTLEGMTLTLPDLAPDEVFRCRYRARFDPDANNHLGIVGPFEPQTVGRGRPVPPGAWSFQSDGDAGLTWNRFDHLMRTSQTNVLRVDVVLAFDRGTETLALKASVAQLHAYMEKVERVGQDLLKFAQLEVLNL